MAKILLPQFRGSIVIHPLWQLFLFFRSFGFRSLLEGLFRSSIELRRHQCPESRVWVVDELHVRPGLGDVSVYISVSSGPLLCNGSGKPSNTTMRSARAIVDSLCATSKHVVCFLRRILSIASLT